jgi:Na+-translocating ferredoxin:NAD+ oxidoreductase RnfD subunit
VLGFEQSHLQSIVAVLAAYLTEMALEGVSALSDRRRPRFLTGRWQNRIDFFLPPHISGLAVGMLTYANDRLWVVVFGAVLAIASKALFRAPVDGKMRHFFNPSNLGISATLLCFPWVGVAMPYQFTENYGTPLDLGLPFVIICAGSLLNAKLTGRMPLILAWAGGFAVQASIRAGLGHAWLPAALNPMTGAAFILFTFYMITDPQTTPSSPKAQVLFGLLSAAAYGVLLELHVVYTLFFSLLVACTLRGTLLWTRYLLSRPTLAPAIAQ